MNSINSVLNSMGRQDKVLRKTLWETGMIFSKVDGDGLNLGLQLPALDCKEKSEAVLQAMESIKRLGFFELKEADRSWFVFQLFVESAFIGTGPKVFCIKASQCKILENVDLGINVEDFQAPFDVFAISFDKDYSSGVYVTTDDAQKAVPLYAIFCRVGARCLVSVRMQIGSEFAYYLHKNIYLKSGWTVEESIQFADNNAIVGTELNDDEKRLQTALMSVVFNVALLATIKSFSKRNDPHIEKLADLARSGPERFRLRNKFDYETRPIWYDLNQNVPLFESRTERAGSVAINGSPLRPHYRRGHWAMLAVGPGRTERRHVFRKPTFVNFEFFAGDKSEQVAIYRG